jgi:hypothetical protein
VPESRSRWTRALEYFGLAHLVHTLAQTEFVRTLLWPAVLTLATGGAGVLGGIPSIYILVACAISFGAIERSDALRLAAALGRN